MLLSKFRWIPAVLLIFWSLPLFSAAAPPNEPILGRWEGTTSVMGTELDFQLDFKEANGALTATIDIPAQGARAVPLTNVRWDGTQAHVELPAGPGLAVWEGTLKDGRLQGKFTQGGAEGTFTMSRPNNRPKAPPAAHLLPIIGKWEGAAALGGTEIPFSVEFSADGANLSATWDCPQQGAFGIKLKNVRFAVPQVHFELAGGAGLAIWEGDLKDGLIEGKWSQAGGTGAFHLNRPGAAPKPAAAAPAEKPPYREEEVLIQSGAVKLAGTLTIPEGKGPFPAVILLTGSGPQNRDEELFGFKPFRLLADAFTRKEIIVLRCDDRGIGGSSGSSNEATLEDLTADAEAMLRFLKKRPEVLPTRIGFLGHSQGGLVAPMVAVQAPEVAFLVLLSGPATPAEQILLAQAELIAKASGATPESIHLNATIQKLAFTLARTGQGQAEFEAAIVKAAKDQFAALPEDQRKALPNPEELAKGQAQQQLAVVRAPWFRSFLLHDPAPVLEKVRCPILALFGELDLQVPAQENKEALLQAAAKGGNCAVKVEVVPKANHLYQEARTGSPLEYPSLPKAFVPGLIDSIAVWIKAIPNNKG